MISSRFLAFVAAGLLAGSACSGFVSPAAADDWPQFRGPDGNGISAEKQAPVEWSREQNVRWRVELPPGNSSPVVSQGKVFQVAATENGRLRHTHCFDRRTGEVLWTRTVTFDGQEPTHGTSPHGNATPAVDGDRVVVWHSSAGMYCYDYDGKELWSIDLGDFIHIWGYGASPIIYQDLVINNCGPGENTFLVALNKETGEIVWKTPEEGGNSGQGGGGANWTGSWSTPQMIHVDGQDQVLMSWPGHAKAYDPRDGKLLWQVSGLGKLVYTSPLVGLDADGQPIGVAMSGYGGPAIGFRLGGQGDMTDKNRLWHAQRRQPQRIGTGVIWKGLVYMVNENGTVYCIDPVSGENRWESRLNAQGNLWSSLTCVNGRMYVMTKRGEIAIFDADPDKFAPVAVNSLGEHSDSTIAVSDGELFIRTFQALYCISDKTDAGAE